VNTNAAMKPNSFKPIPEWKYRLRPGAPAGGDGFTIHLVDSPSGIVVPMSGYRKCTDHPVLWLKTVQSVLRICYGGNHSSAYNQNSFIARAMNADLDSKTLNGPYHADCGNRSV
jgi:hypothetical protein